MRRLQKKFTTFATVLAVGGSCFQIGGCNAFEAISSVVSNINPCGTILACDPREYAFITSGIDGPGANPDIDPYCVFPPFCTADVDPIFGGLTGATPQFGACEFPYSDLSSLCTLSWARRLFFMRDARRGGFGLRRLRINYALRVGADRVKRASTYEGMETWMPKRGRRHIVPLLLGLLGLLTWLPAGSAERENAASATLPESNEALLISSKIEDALHAGDYRLAIECVEQLKNLPAGLVAAPASRTFYPVWRQAFRLLKQLPPEGLTLYRQLHDAEVRSRFAQAAADCDIAQLRELFRGYTLCTDWPRIREELAAQLLDRGEFNEAVETLRGFGAGVDEDAPESQSLMIIALARAGVKQAARERLAALRLNPAIAGQVAWQERLETLERWLDQETPGGAGGETEPFRPRIDIGSAWGQAFSPSEGIVSENEADDLATAAENLRRLPFQNVVLIENEGVLILRQLGTIAAFDADTLWRLWEVREQILPTPAISRGGYLPPAGTEARGALSNRNRALLGSRLQHAVSAGFGRIYTIESLPPADADLTDFARMPFQPYEGFRRWNELVARDPTNGRVIWSTHGDPAHPLFEATFQDVPLVTDRFLAAPFTRGEDLLLAVLDPETGAVQKEFSLVGPPTEFPAAGGRCLLTQDSTSVYVCTGNGVIAALSRDDLGWKWAATYPSDLAERLGRLWWQPAESRSDPNIDPPVLVGDLLIVAPVDSDEIIALNRFDGTEAWRLPRRDEPYLIGTMRASAADENAGGESRDRLLLAGRTVACYPADSPDADRPLWRSAPLHITGRAVCRAPCVYVPTRDGVLVLDGETGKILFDQNPTHAAFAPAASASEIADAALSSPGVERLLQDTEPTQNLVAGPTALYGVSPNRLVKYPDPARLRERCRELAGAAPTEKSVLMDAWLEALDRDYEKALAGLDALPAETPGTAPIRDRLVTYLFLQLARRTGGGDEQLNWLRHAKTLAASSGAAARMDAMIGAVLEDEQRWDAALDHYLEQLLADEPAAINDPRNPNRTCAAWVYAARRIQALTRKTAVGAWDRFLAAGALVPAAAAKNLPRLRVALLGEPQQSWIEVLLCFERIAPELKSLYLKKDVPDFLSPALRRWFLLERWDTQVSLGELDRAEEDRAAYVQAAAAASAADVPTWLGAYVPPNDVEQDDRAAAIELAARKLRQFDARSYAPPVTRQWKIEHAELFQDSRRPLANIRSWILVADLEQRRIELINAYKHQQPQRQTSDQLEDVGEGWQASPTAAARRFESEGGPHAAWPTVFYDQLAAVPVPGGLIGLGLGPERYAGRRLWSYAVPEWSAIPDDFAARALDGPEGVYFTPRPDRVTLVGWLDGRLRWQLDFPGITIERLEMTGDSLAIISADRGVWLVDAVFGDQPRRIEMDETPVRVDVVGDTLVMWGRETVRGLSSRDLSTLWEKPCDAVADVWRFPEGPWLAYRTENSSYWRLFDARRGADAFDATLGGFDQMSAAYVEGRRLYVAGMSSGPGEQGELRHLTLRALDLEDGAELWSHEFDSNVRVNPTQLAAHPDYIPFLLNGIGGSRIEGVEYPLMQWVAKADGRLCEPLSIRADFRGMVDATCEMVLLATPTRIIVQIGGNVLAYGNSPLRQGP